MLIVCPACASEYEIAADRIGASGRSVRCAACRETWFITSEADPTAETEAVLADADESVEPGAGANGIQEPAAAEFSAVEPEASFERPAPSSRLRKAKSARPTSRPAFSPALAAALAVFALVPLALLGRATVVRAAPQTAGLFSRIGLPVNLRGIDFRDVVAFQNPAEGDKPAELVIEGDLIGVARDRTDVPDILIEVRDEHDAALQHWTVPSPRPALENAETARFRASLSAPPAKGRGVHVRFADAETAEAKTTEAKTTGADHSAAEPAAASHAELKDAAAGHAPAHGH